MEGARLLITKCELLESYAEFFRGAAGPRLQTRDTRNQGANRVATVRI